MLLFFSLFLFSSVIAFLHNCDISVNSMTNWSVLKFPKTKWSSHLISVFLSFASFRGSWTWSPTQQMEWQGESPQPIYRHWTRIVKVAAQTTYTCLPRALLFNPMYPSTLLRFNTRLWASLYTADKQMPGTIIHSSRTEGLLCTMLYLSVFMMFLSFILSVLFDRLSLW